MQSIKARFIQSDLVFINSIFQHRLDCAQLTSLFGLATPVRRSRHTGLFHVPFGRVSTVKAGFLSRIPSTCNRLLQDLPSADFFNPVSFKSHARRFAGSQGTYIS